MHDRWALGVDLGSVTVKVVLLDERLDVAYQAYRRTEGASLKALIDRLEQVRAVVGDDGIIGSVGTTGSGRHLAAALLGADVVKNEITAHAAGTLRARPDTRTIMEIGGQDSKIIQIEDGMVMDFAMNTVCAAGTGAFLDQQAQRLGIDIDRFGPFALTARKAVRIAGRCSVFAESDMIAKQQLGHSRADLCLGLCHALVRNYLCNLAGGGVPASPIAFQGGVSHNAAILACLEEALGDAEIFVPEHATVCGAIGAAILARDHVGDGPSRFAGWKTGPFEVVAAPCDRCQERCEVLLLLDDGRETARWGGRCDRHMRVQPT
ncbi:MAG: acyl-CoA dehydratase activase [Planctomycetota bacterium]